MEGTETFKFSFFKRKKLEKNILSLAQISSMNQLKQLRIARLFLQNLLTNNLCGVGQQIRGHGSQLHQAEQWYKRTNPHEPESIPTAKSGTHFISESLATASTKMILTLIMLVQLEK